MDRENDSLRRTAFAFSLTLTIMLSFFLLPLCWMIPMTVHTYRIFKGKCNNTVAFGVCELLFVGFVPGILLLCSKKEYPEDSKTV